MDEILAVGFSMYQVPGESSMCRKPHRSVAAATSIWIVGRGASKSLIYPYHVEPAIFKMTYVHLQ